ncbi:MAG: T9SS type A sorting domain-containing protein [Flavobacteriales bacterium]|nr:T9SS type A sorting domain-containing protein [Flavobacteriales bacterium]
MHLPTTLALLALCSHTAAQSPYHPFPEGEAGWLQGQNWDQPNQGDCNIGYSWFACERPFYLGADSIMDGVVYQTLLGHGQCTWSWINPPFPLPPWCSTWGTYAEPQGVMGFLRQNVDERRVYFLPANSQEEELLYDFTIGLGPYPATWNNPIPGNLYVVALDSVELNDGWHRTWALGWSWNGQDVPDEAFAHVIEGVGSDMGLLNPLVPPLPAMSTLTCHSAEGVTLYPLFVEACGLNVSMHDREPVPGLRIWPNPVHDQLFLSQPISGSVHDIHGRQVRHVTNAQVIQVNDLAPGVYILRMDDGGAQRFVVER